MPTPSEIKASEDQSSALAALHHIASLERCEGFKKWLGPRIFKAYDAAGEAILTAASQGQVAATKDIVTFQTFHDIVTACRRDKKAALAKTSKTQI